MHEGVCLKKKMTKWLLWELKTIIPLYGFWICMDSAFMGQSSPTTAFDEAIWYFADTM